MRLLNDFTQAAAASGRSLASLLREALTLRLSPTRLGLSEYLDFQLYRDDLDAAAKARFGGQRTQGVLEEILIDDYSKFLSLDKITMYAVLKGHGIPIPEVRATYRAARPDSAPSIANADELEAYLRRPEALPVYIKRAFGAYGRGNMLVQRCDGSHVVLGNASSEPIADFCRTLDDGRTLGWILQQPLVPHPAIRTLTQSEKVSGLRIHSFLSDRDTRVIKAIFKINVGVKDSDNFEHGASGNMLAAVDIATGQVVRAIAGTGLRQVENPRHPRTGSEIVGFQLPYWDEVLKLVQNAHKAFPGFICPGWDIALCEDGPKILEVNAFGDIDLSQHAYRVGFLDEEFLSLMRQRQLDHLLRAAPRPSARSPVNHRLGVRKHHWSW